MDMVKRSTVARGLGGGHEQGEHRGFLGQWKYSDIQWG